MTGPVIQGWCPGALRPMLSGDGWVVRVRPLAGRLTGAQAAGIAGLAGAHGSGLIDLSSRANVQVRGVREDRLEAMTEGLGALGLLDESAAAEARRNIVVTPFWQAGDGTAELALALAKGLEQASPALPGKFGFAVDTGALPVLRGVSADIRIERGAAGLLVRADGAGAGLPVAGPTEAVQAALALAEWFVSGGGAADGRGRMAAHLARVALPAAFGGEASPQGLAGRQVPGPCPAGFLVAFAFGQTDAATFAALAEPGPLRLTPWRMVLAEGRTDAPALPGLITDPADPLLRVIACTGAPGCPQGRQPTRPLARALAAHVPPGRVLHVSGCAKGCAHPGLADVTLTAGAKGFGLIRGGAASAPFEQTLTAGAILARPGLIFGGA